MKPHWADQKVYDLYNEFIGTCILHEDSILTDEKDIFKLSAIDDNIQRFIINGIEGNENFDLKIAKQFTGATYESKLAFAHANWFWVISPSDITKNYKKGVPRNILGDQLRVPLRDNITPGGGFGSAGLWLKQNKFYEITFIILLFKQLKMLVANNVIENLEQANKYIESFCLECSFNSDNETSDIISSEIRQLLPKGRLAMFNILLHLCNPDKYEPIVSESHKNQILDAFSSLLEDAPKETKAANREEKILMIRQIISEFKKESNFTFYDDEIYHIWNFSSGEKDFNEFQALQSPHPRCHRNKSRKIIPHFF